MKYIVGTGIMEVTWTDSAVTTTKPDFADCGPYSWAIIDTETNFEPDSRLFYVDTEAQFISVDTDDVSLTKTYNLQV